MAITTIYTYPLDGSQREFTIPFEYLARRFVVLTLIGTDRRELKLTTDYRFISKTAVQTTVAWGPGDGYERIEVRRNTSATERLVDFADGSILRASELNTSQVQTLHVAEEARNMVADTISTNQDGDLDARGRRLVNLADATEEGHAVTLRQEQEWAQSTLGNALAAKASELASKDSETKAKDSETKAKASELVSKDSETKAKASELASKDSETKAKASELASKDSETKAKASELASKDSETKAKASELASAASVASVNLPQITSADFGKVLRVKSDGSGFELVNPPSGPLLNIRWVEDRSMMEPDEVPLDGQLLTRLLYPQAWARISTVPILVTDAVWNSDALQRGKYSSGDGASTFRVPDFNGKQAGSIGAVVLRGDGLLSAGGAGLIQRSATKATITLGEYSAYQYGTIYRNLLGKPGNGAAGSTSNYFTGNVNFNVGDGDETRGLNVTGCFVVRLRP